MRRLKELRWFFLQHATSIRGDTAKLLSLGKLNSLRYSPFGRNPTDQEWADLETIPPALLGRLPEQLRRRFVVIPHWMATLAIIFIIVAVFCLIRGTISAAEFLKAYSVAHPTAEAIDLAGLGAGVAPEYLLWVISLGALGSLSFLGMNALSIQSDITFDLTNQTFFLLRLVLGALFALVLTAPVGVEPFVFFLADQARGTGRMGANTYTLGKQLMLLLLPFVLGYSTSLVVTILNRLVEAVRTFFGSAVQSSGRSQMTRKFATEIPQRQSKKTKPTTPRFSRTHKAAAR